MGLNCVAGTTEYDEDEGIGLVLYTNSEGQLIVWKMSDGTKQGSAVPLTTDYQSMLKSEFENKTGITIGYIIIHPYTEETIDIESSITINSGDTPEETLYFKRKDQIGTTYLIAKYGTKSKNLLLGSVSSGTMYLVIDPGKIVSNQGPTVENFAPQYKQIAEAAGYEVNSTGAWLPEWEVGDEIENWDSYISV